MPGDERNKAGRISVARAELSSIVRTFFISHNWNPPEDLERALEIESWLREDLHQDTLIDYRDAVPSTPIDRFMTESEKRADHTICIITPDYLARNDCLSEMNAAAETTKTGGKPYHLIVVLAGDLSEADVAALPEEVRRSIYIDLRKLGKDEQKKNFKEGILKCIKNPDIYTDTELENDATIFFAPFDHQKNNYDPEKFYSAWSRQVANEMREAIGGQNINFIELDKTVKSEKHAQQILSSSGAWMLVWGTFTDNGYGKTLNIHYSLRNDSEGEGELTMSKIGTKFSVRENHDEGVVDIDSFDLYLEEGGSTKYIIAMLVGGVSYYKNAIDECLDICSNALSDANPTTKEEKKVIGELYKLRGMAYARLRQYDLSAQDYRIAASLFGHEKNDYIEEIPPLDELSIKYRDGLTEILGSLAGAYNYLGDRCSESSKFSEAIEYYSAAIKLADSDRVIYTSALFNRGNAHLSLGNYEHSLIDYNQLAAEGESSSKLYTNRAIANLYLENLIESIDNFTIAIELDSHNVRAYEGRVQAYIEQQLFELAEQDCEELIRQNRENTFAFYSLGKIGLLTENHFLAHTGYDEAISLGMKSKETYKGRATANLLLGFYEDAANDFETAIQLNDNDPTSYYGRYTALKYIGNYVEALIDIETYARLSGNNGAEIQAAIDECRKNIN